MASYMLNLSKNDDLNINGVITQPQSNRSLGAKVDFWIKDNTTTYHFYSRTPNVTLHWTVPQNGSYFFVFDNRFDSASKDVLIMATKSWHGPKQFTMLVNFPLLGYWALLVGAIVCAVGVTLITVKLLKKTV